MSHWRDSELGGKLGLHALGNLVHEGHRVQVLVRCDLCGPVHTYGQILGVQASLDGLNHACLQALSKDGQLLVVVQLGSVGKPPCPGIDRGHWIGRGGIALLVLPPMPCDGACKWAKSCQLVESAESFIMQTPTGITRGQKVVPSMLLHNIRPRLWMTDACDQAFTLIQRIVEDT